MYRQSRGTLRNLSNQWKNQRDCNFNSDRGGKEELRSCVAYKLKEINQRFGSFLRQGAYVVDLGASPGGFSKLAANLIHVDSAIDRWRSTQRWAGRHLETNRTLGGVQVWRKHGRLICVDVQDMTAVPGAIFVRGDINAESTREQILFGLDGREADVVLSDMSPGTTGTKETNHARIMELADEAMRHAMSVLRNGGTFCCKIFSGSDEGAFRAELQKRFVTVKAFKPMASRKNSRELYYVASGFVPDHFRPAETSHPPLINTIDLSGSTGRG